MKQNQLQKGYAELAVLTCLKHKPKHGYAIAAWIKKQSKGKLTLAPGSLYPLLHSLQNKKRIDASWKASPKGPRKKIYRLTPKGLKELQNQKKNIQSFHTSIASFLKS